VSTRYRPVSWNRNKRVYDVIVAGGIAGYLGTFVSVGLLVNDRVGLPELALRALGTCGLILLHVVLAIGPLARLDRRFLPVLYNRRHLGVATFLVGLAHGGLAVGYYHGFGTLNPFVSLLTANTDYGSLQGFPFELLGLFGLAVLFLLAATSHDFWQKTLGRATWKWLHMLVYPAYASLVLHVALGALQDHRPAVYPVLLVTGFVTIAGLHLAVGWRERRRDGMPRRIPLAEAWVDVAAVDEIPDGRAKVVCLPDRERVAVFRIGDRLAAVTNVCAHQGGPLGEGKVVRGCLTCPWHGWAYRAEDGCAPPPFVERVATYRVRVAGCRVLLDPDPPPPGTPTDPACIGVKSNEPVEARQC
jgi:DMSO/TMAO reductase YedYZ heme-binding membrane subunit/nitrite reductase/ring-hydroxylating ferredoxin subunit